MNSANISGAMTQSVSPQVKPYTHSTIQRHSTTPPHHLNGIGGNTIGRNRWYKSTPLSNVPWQLNVRSASTGYLQALSDRCPDLARSAPRVARPTRSKAPPTINDGCMDDWDIIPSEKNVILATAKSSAVVVDFLHPATPTIYPIYNDILDIVFPQKPLHSTTRLFVLKLLPHDSSEHELRMNLIMNAHQKPHVLPLQRYFDHTSTNNNKMRVMVYEYTGIDVYNALYQIFAYYADIDTAVANCVGLIARCRECIHVVDECGVGHRDTRLSNFVTTVVESAVTAEGGIDMLVASPVYIIDFGLSVVRDARRSNSENDPRAMHTTILHDIALLYFDALLVAAYFDNNHAADYSGEGHVAKLISALEIDGALLNMMLAYHEKQKWPFYDGKRLKTVIHCIRMSPDYNLYIDQNY